MPFRRHRLALALVAAIAVPPVAAAGCETAAPAIDAAVRKTLAQGAPGMLVGAWRDGEPRFVRAWGQADVGNGRPMDTDARFPMASVTKTFTAVAALSLAEDGRLDLDAPLADFLPAFPHADRITVRHLLVQTSGLPDYAGTIAAEGTQALARTPEAMTDWIAAHAKALDFEPGTAWAYSNSNYVLLGRVLEIASGQPLPALFAERLFAPAGLRDTRFDDPREVVPGRALGYRRDKAAPSGFAHADWIHPSLPGAAGGLRTTLNDLARWQQALFDGRVIGEAALQALMSPGRLDDGRPTREGMPPAWREGLRADYGHGLFIGEHAGRRRLWHSGDLPGFSAWVARYPDQDATIVLVINSESADMDRDGIEAALFEACLAPG